MNVQKRGSRSHDETDGDRLRGILAHDALSVGLVSAFAMILPLTNARGAAEIAERIRAEAMRIHAGGRALTISSGVASCSEKTAAAHALVEKADRALYQAKRSGKNRVVVI